VFRLIAWMAHPHCAEHLYLCRQLRIRNISTTFQAASSLILLFDPLKNGGITVIMFEHDTRIRNDKYKNNLHVYSPADLTKLFEIVLPAKHVCSWSKKPGLIDPCSWLC
jgi:hypothetical protein